VNKVVDITQQIERKIDALCEHVCQMEMTIAELQVELAASGLDIPLLSGADPKNYRPVIDAQIRGWAAATGKAHGFAFAEQFRRVRFGGVSRWARGAATLPDDV
jgi:hypothetical protein